MVAPSVVPYEIPFCSCQTPFFLFPNHHNTKARSKQKHNPRDRAKLTPVPYQPILRDGLRNAKHIPRDKSSANKLANLVGISVFFANIRVDSAALPGSSLRVVRLDARSDLVEDLAHGVGIVGADEGDRGASSSVQAVLALLFAFTVCSLLGSEIGVGGGGNTPRIKTDQVVFTAAEPIFIRAVSIDFIIPTI